jgi:hypothetical protein
MVSNPVVLSRFPLDNEDVVIQIDAKFTGIEKRIKRRVMKKKLAGPW